MKLILPAAQFDPEHVFSCGQTFRYREENGVWRGVAMGNLVEAQRAADSVRLTMCGRKLPEAAWREYFDLDRDYGSLFPEPDEVLSRAVSSAPGLRVVSQEPFETLISFIISANNNIPRISGTVEAICQEAGEPFETGGRRLYAFPEPERLAALSETDLRRLGAGYRAPYILASARQAAEEDFAALRQLPTQEVTEHLMAYPGVGPKVAGCIALFALGKRDAFPADVWIRRIVRQLYGFEGSARALQEFALHKFGENAGLAQQYLFHYARRGLMPSAE